MNGADFVTTSLISIAAIAVTCLMVYECLRAIWAIMPRLTFAPRLRILLMIVPIYAVHIVNIWLYAGVFFLIENYTAIGSIMRQSAAIRGHASAPNYDTFLDCLYFSSSTYTSLGFGDFLPTGNLRMLAAAEVLDGLVMIGWTISFTYLAMEKFWADAKPGKE